jgi:hypothetical protein
VGAGFKWPWQKNKGGRPVLTEESRDRKLIERLVEMQEQARKDAVRQADTLTATLDRIVESRFDRARAIPSPRAAEEPRSPVDESEVTEFLETLRSME